MHDAAMEQDLARKIYLSLSLCLGSSGTEPAIPYTHQMINRFHEEWKAKEPELDLVRYALNARKK